MRIVMVGRDIAPSRAFALVKAKLIEKGIEVISHLGNGSPIESSMETIRKDVQKSDAVLLGLSSSAELAKEEICAAREANFLNIPYGFYADMPNVASRCRAWFLSVQEKAKFVFIFSHAEAESCKEIFPSAEIVPTGNPMLENVFFYPDSYEVTRKRLGIAEHELLAYCTAGKDLEANRIHFRAVAEAISRLISRKLWKVFFMLHPGDRNSTDAYLESAKGEGFVSRVVPGKELNHLDVLKACDLLIGSASTTEMEAAIMRKPVVTVLIPKARERLIQQYGTDRWYPCEIGIAKAVTGDERELTGVISDMVFGNSYLPFLERQKLHFPMLEERGTAVNKMVDHLLKIMSLG